MESRCVTWVWVMGMVPVRPEARRSLKSDKPHNPWNGKTGSRSAY